MGHETVKTFQAQWRAENRILPEISFDIHCLPSTRVMESTLCFLFAE